MEERIRNVSDTALWTAIYRAEESKRSDKLFNDPFAEKLGGERGRKLIGSVNAMTKNLWSFTTRTVLIDECIEKLLSSGIDTVINLAAGLDARPYRLKLPPNLNWIEVDLPDILKYKEKILQDENPVCHLQRISTDLSDSLKRKELFDSLSKNTDNALIISEGLLMYLEPQEVQKFCHDLSSFPAFRYWIIDIASPGLKEMMEKQIGDQLKAADATFKFAPAEGPGFFLNHSWQPVEVHSLLKKAAKLKRLPFFLRLIALLPESKEKQGKRPWSAMCLLKNITSE